MSVVDYVQTPFMRCPTCGGDMGWESKTRTHPQCDEVTVAQLMAEDPENWHGRKRVSMVGDCVRCNYFIEVYIYGGIIVEGEASSLREEPLS